MPKIVNQKYSSDGEMQAFCEDLLLSVSQMKARNFSAKVVATPIIATRKKTGLTQENFECLGTRCQETIRSRQNPLKNCR